MGMGVPAFDCKIPRCSRFRCTATPPRQAIPRSPPPVEGPSKCCGTWSRTSWTGPGNDPGFLCNGMLISVMSGLTCSRSKSRGPIDLSRVRKVRRHDGDLRSRKAMVTSQRHKRHDDPYIFFLSQDSDYSQLQSLPSGVTRLKRKGKEHTNDHHTEPADRRRAH